MEKIDFVNGSTPALNATNLNKLQDNIEDTINNDIFDLIYPIGSIYMSVNTTNPASLFGGTWEKIKDKFLLASGDTYLNGSVGGEATHTLTVDEMPSHRHTIGFSGGNESGYGFSWTNNTRTMYNADNVNIMGNTGENSAFNIMPPYLAVNVWKRTG